MRAERPHIAVIGAGVVGASIAYHLARSGAMVRLVDGAPGPARGVTGRAFGWINLVNGDPANRPAYALRRQAVADYARLMQELPEAFRRVRRGSLVWKTTAEATATLAARHGAEDGIVLVERSVIARAEPRLRNAPPVAASSSNDLAVSPLHLTTTLVRAATDSGAAACWGHDIIAIEVSDARVTGIRVADRTIAADVVIVAAGPGTNVLTKPLGIDVGLTISPVLLLRYAAESRFVGQIVRSPALEIRQAEDNTLRLVEGFRDDSPENGPGAVGRRMLDVVKATFDVPGAVTFVAAAAGARPIFADGLPRVGFAKGVDGLYVAVGHPGVILAPLLGRLVADEIVHDSRSPLLGAGIP